MCKRSVRGCFFRISCTRNVYSFRPPWHLKAEVQASVENLRHQTLERKNAPVGVSTTCKMAHKWFPWRTYIFQSRLSLGGDRISGGVPKRSNYPVQYLIGQKYIRSFRCVSSTICVLQHSPIYHILFDARRGGNRGSKYSREIYARLKP